MRRLSNRQLKLERIPDPDVDPCHWDAFARTINGYEVAGSFEACAELYHDKNVTTLTELRCALFFASRKDGYNWSPEGETPVARELLRRIRAKVAAGELD